MFGRTCYSILMLCFGCLDTREGIEFPETNAMPCQENQAEPQVESLEPQEVVSEEDSRKDSKNLKEGVFLTPETLEAEWGCALFSQPVSYRITETKSKLFLLMPVQDLQYCVIVTRHSGYITIQHEEGNVTREGDHFMWCLSRQVLKEEERVGTFAKLDVLSLTPEAEFTIALRRGVE